MFHLDMIQTVACAGCALFLGVWVRDRIPFLARYNLPAPVIGGLVVAAVVLLFRMKGGEVRFDVTLQNPLMVAFFTSIGFSASLGLLRRGGPQVLLFLAISSVAAVAQNLLGMGIATTFGLPPLFGVLTGSVTLTGGPATGLAFAPLFEQAGVVGAPSIAVAAAMAGIIAGGVIGGPVGTILIERRRLRRAVSHAGEDRGGREAEDVTVVLQGERGSTAALLKALVVFAVAMGAGGWISGVVASWGVTLPAYIGAMLVASMIRNVDDRTDLVGLPGELLEVVGSASLSLFLAMALMGLRLWELAGVALPLLVIVAAQVLLILLLCLTAIPRFMGRDYDAAVMSGGFAGFMLGTTANAMANMEAIVQRFGPAPRAFLVVPLVGAFFIDFVNALIITIFLN
jgi:glutamate:Na+ symporter, ESS family